MTAKRMSVESLILNLFAYAAALQKGIFTCALDVVVVLLLLMLQNITCLVCTVSAI